MSDWRSRALPVKNDWRSRALSPEVLPAEEPPSTAGQTFLEEYGNTATIGYLPHLQALASRAMPDPSSDLDEKLRAQGFQISQPVNSYVSERDANIARQAKQRADNPLAAKLGTGAGILAGGLLMPGGSAAQGSSRLGKELVRMGLGAKGARAALRVAQAGKTGAILGGIANPGDVEGEVALPVLDDFGARAKNAGVGGLFGLGSAAAIEAGQAGLNAASRWMGDKAARKATRALGQPTQKVAEEMRRTGEDVAIGRELLDQKALPILSTPKRLQRRIEALKEKTWQPVEDLLSKGGDGAVVDGTEAALKILDNPKLADLRKAGETKVVKAYEQAADELANSGRLSLRESQAIKKTLDERINYNKGIPDLEGAQEARFLKRTALRDSMDEAVSKLGAEKGALKSAFRKHGRLEKASDLAEKEIARAQKNRAISLTDTIMGIGGSSFGDTPIEKAGYGALIGLLNKGGRTFGNSIQARGYNAASKAIANNPRLAALSAAPGAVGAMASRAAVGNGEQMGPSDPILSDPKLLQFFERYPNLVDALIAEPERRDAVRKRLKRKPAKEK